MPEAVTHEKRIMLPDTETSFDALKRVLAMQGYEVNKKNAVVGKLAKGMTIVDLSKKHRVDLEELKYELDKGIQTELEHTDDLKIAEAIAMDHLYERPDYYTKLQEMEQSYSSGGPVRIPSTDPSTWNAEYQIGDKVLIRIDFAGSSTNVNEVRTIVNVRTFLGQYINPTSSGIQRPENPSGRSYTLDNGQEWEGKDLEYANVQIPQAQPAKATFPVPSTSIPTPTPISLPGLQTPTGEPSRLDFQMQALTRTSAFKAFFGDWETAAANFLRDQRQNMDKHYKDCSVAVDAVTLEPRIMFHGTNAEKEFFEFDVLEKDRQGVATQKRPYGYFAFNKEYSDNFTVRPQRPTTGPTSPFMYKCFLSVRKPFYAIEPQFQSMAETEDVWLHEIAKRITDDLHANTNLSPNIYNVRLKKQQDMLEAKFKKGTPNPIPFWQYMARDIDSEFKYFLMSYGYDSIIYYENFQPQFDYDNPAQYTKAIAVFEPRQIKLADGRNIDFNPMTTDIRYETGGPTMENIDAPLPITPKTNIEAVERVIFPWKYAQGGKVEGKGLKDGDNGKKGGYLVGKSHAQGGIKAFNVDTGQPLEVEGNEVIITKRAVLDDTKRLFEGEMLTNREILSRINQSGGGVSFEKGGVMEHCGCTGKKYDYGGLLMSDYDVVGLMSYPEQVVNTMQEQANRFANYLVRSFQQKP